MHKLNIKIVLHGERSKLLSISWINETECYYLQIQLDVEDSLKFDEKDCLTPLDALYELIDIVQDKKEKTKCEQQRIVIFVGKYGGLSKISQENITSKLKLQESIHKLKKFDIIVDCIQVSHSHTPNSDLVKLSQSNHGRFRAPSVNKNEWDTVVTCNDFVMAHQRKVSIQNAIVISDSDWLIDCFITNCFKCLRF